MSGIFGSDDDKPLAPAAAPTFTPDIEARKIGPERNQGGTILAQLATRSARQQGTIYAGDDGSGDYARSKLG